MKTLATLAVLGQGMYYATINPGIMDSVNGGVLGLVVYAIWFSRDRASKIK